MTGDLPKMFFACAPPKESHFGRLGLHKGSPMSAELKTSFSSPLKAISALKADIYVKGIDTDKIATDVASSGGPRTVPIGAPSRVVRGLHVTDFTVVNSSS
jgi:hypothetical protein